MDEIYCKKYEKEIKKKSHMLQDCYSQYTKNSKNSAIKKYVFEQVFVHLP